jgi:hypothetical protein
MNFIGERAGENPDTGWYGVRDFPVHGTSKVPFYDV